VSPFAGFVAVVDTVILMAVLRSVRTDPGRYRRPVITVAVVYGSVVTVAIGVKAAGDLIDGAYSVAHGGSATKTVLFTAVLGLLASVSAGVTRDLARIRRATRRP
jgi:hypothetical protein